MLPEEIYAGSSSSSNFKYSHPLNHAIIDDEAIRARVAYDLMTFLNRQDYDDFFGSNTERSPFTEKDEIDILIADGFHKEAERLIDLGLKNAPDDDKLTFQKSFVTHLKYEYKRIIDNEDLILQHEPRNINALINKGFALANTNREEEALTMVNKALHIEPENVTALMHKAYIAKLLERDDLREKTIMAAYNASAKQRLAELEDEEATLLRDFGSLFIESETPSAFEVFNLHSSGSASSHMVH